MDARIKAILTKYHQHPYEQLLVGLLCNEDYSAIFTKKGTFKKLFIKRATKRRIGNLTCIGIHPATFFRAYFELKFLCGFFAIDMPVVVRAAFKKRSIVHICEYAQFMNRTHTEPSAIDTKRFISAEQK